MKEYIERELAIAETRKPRLTDAELRRRIANIPAADVRPEVRGEWIEDGYYNEPCVCSNCGEPCRDFVMGKPRWNYCPNCGALMDKDGDGDV